MIDKRKVEKLVAEKLKKDMFLVNVSVSKSNAINIFVDGFDGITIGKCVEISRHVENALDRDEEDYELQVSSPGLTESFVIKEQYLKNIGRDIEVVTTSGEKITGELKEADAENILLESRRREKLEGHKKKQMVVKEHKLAYDEIKTARVVISFKN
ncbi:MAG: ribosome assembly cofactor RimP [Prolixibacteraceae bacterium]